MLKSSCHNREHRGFHLLLLNDAIWRKCWEVDLVLSGLTLHSNNSRCLVLIPHRKFGSYLLNTMESCGLTTQHIHNTLHKSIFDTQQQPDYSLRPRTVSWTESRWWSAVLIYAAKTVSSWSRNSGLVTCLQDQHQGDTNHQTCKCCTNTHLCINNI